MPLLLVDSISKTYPKESRASLSPISFELNKGEVLVIFGKSGAGKTTLLNIVAGLLSPDTGTVVLEGETILFPHQKLVAGHEELKMVHQDFNLKHKMTVKENINYTLLPYTKDYRVSRIKVLLKLCGLEDMANKDVSELSGGQKQRVALARALANEPRVLLMDEPFSNLDSITKRILFQEVKTIVKQTSTSVIFVSHDSQDALSFADKILVLENGQMLQYDTPYSIYSHPKSIKVAQLFSEVFSVMRSGKVPVYYRPETIVISDPEKSDFTSKVQEVIFMGHYQVLVFKSPYYLKTLDFRKRFKIGDEVGLKIDEGKVLRF